MEQAVLKDGDFDGRPNSFCIETPERSYWFQAESALSKKEWLIALSRAIGDEENDLGLVFEEKDVLTGLKMVYNDHLASLEEEYLFHDFHSLPLKGVDFMAKPIVLLIGQYSVGKTSFIEFMIQRSLPGQRIGPEPTTDRFVAVVHDDDGNS